MINIKEYVRQDGSNPFRAWFDALDPQAAAKIATAIMRMEMGATASINGSMASANIESIGVPVTESI